MEVINMEIEIKHTQQGGWARISINGEYIGNARIKKDDFLNGSIKIKKTQITGQEKVYQDKEKYPNWYDFKEKVQIVAEYIIGDDINE